MNKNEKIEYKKMLTSEWSLTVNEKLEREFQFNDFRQSMSFVNAIAELAEQEQHHPDICISYSSVNVQLTTHDAGGLTENDFIMAAKIESI